MEGEIVHRGDNEGKEAKRYYETNRNEHKRRLSLDILINGCNEGMCGTTICFNQFFVVAWFT